MHVVQGDRGRLGDRQRDGKAEEVGGVSKRFGHRRPASIEVNPARVAVKLSVPGSTPPTTGLLEPLYGIPLSCG